MSNKPLTETGRFPADDLRKPVERLVGDADAGQPLSDMGKFPAHDGKGKPLSEMGALERNEGDQYSPENAPNNSRVEKALGYSSNEVMPWAKHMEAPIERPPLHERAAVQEIHDRFENPHAAPPPPQGYLHDAARQRDRFEGKGEESLEPMPSDEPVESVQPATDLEREKPAPTDESDEPRPEVEVSKELRLAGRIRKALDSGTLGADMNGLVPKHIKGGAESRLYLAGLAGRLEQGGEDAAAFNHAEESEASNESGAEVRGQSSPPHGVERHSMLTEHLMQFDASRRARQATNGGNLDAGRVGGQTANAKPTTSGARVDWGRGSGDGHGNRRK